MDDPAVTRNCYILMYKREDEREKEFTEMDASSSSGKDVEGEDLEDNIDFVQKEEGFTSALIGPYQVNAEDIKSLDGSNWITDQVVNSYLYMIQSYTNDTAFMDSFWVPHCIKKGVMQVRKVNNLEHKRVLLIPVHKPAHWGLVIVYIQEGYFVVVDTLKAFGKEVATIVRRFLPRHKIVASRNKALEQKFKPPVYSPSCEE
eukprot:XP_019919429.1 PREDICTED: sentrin-specific protease 5-like isoform X2 [Crassostrea gigas]